MPLWEVVFLGVTAWFALAALIGLTLAAAFNRVARGDMTAAQYEALLEGAMWADRPLNREAEAAERPKDAELTAR
jgi:hypothetical protein